MSTVALSEAESLALSSSSLFYEAVREIHENLRPRYEQVLWDTGPSTLALVCAGITSASVRYAGAIDASFKAGFPNEADTLLRISTENTANLLYILYAGPAYERRSREEIAEQYFAFGETQHGKLVTKSEAWTKQRVIDNGGLAGQAMTLADLDNHMKAVEQKVAAAKARFPQIGSNRWHQLNAEDMIKKVIEHLPPFARQDEELWRMAHLSITTWNFAIHASSFMLNRDPCKASRGDLFTEPGALPVNTGSFAAKQALLNWQAVGDVFGAEAKVIGARFTQAVNQKGKELITTMRANAKNL
jgi:hypothetical protein